MLDVGKNDLKEVITYISKNCKNFDFNNYKFVLTDEEIYVLEQIIKKIETDEDITWESIAYNLYYEKELVKKAVDEETIKQLLFIAYKKIMHVNKYYGDDDKKSDMFKKQTLVDSMCYTIYKPVFDGSITMDEYDKFCKEGPLFAATSRLKRFILKYRIGMIRYYRKLSIDGPTPEFYKDVLTMCKKLGYVDKDLTWEEIDKIIVDENNDLVWVLNFLTKENEMYNVNEVIRKIKSELNSIDDNLSSRQKLENLNAMLEDIKKQLNYVDNTLTFYNQNMGEQYNEVEKRNKA